MGAKSTDNFFGSDYNKVAIDNTTLGTTIIQILNQVWYLYALNQFNKSLSRVVYYSGHGIPTPPDCFISSPKPKNLSYSGLVDSNHSLAAGDWPLHQYGFMGFHCLVSTLFRDFTPLNSGVEKELLIISDCCYSGNWCDQVETVNNIPSGYFLTVQASASTHQCAHAGVFAPVLAALQNDVFRNSLLTEFFELSHEDLIQLEEEYYDLLLLQSPVLRTTRTNYDKEHPVYCLHNFTAERCFYAFNSALFFWYYADKLKFLDDESKLTFSTTKKYPEMNVVDYTYNLLKIDPKNLSNACLTKDSSGYLAKYRFQNGSGVDTHELHVHYNGVLPGVKIGALNIRDVVKGKKKTQAKQVTTTVLDPANLHNWETACKNLLTNIATNHVKALRY
jgi:hypothetical protein